MIIYKVYYDINSNNYISRTECILENPINLFINYGKKILKQIKDKKLVCVCDFMVK